MTSALSVIGNHASANAVPLIVAAPFSRTDSARSVPLLSSAESKRLMQVAVTVHFPKGARLYEEGESAEYIYNLVQGEVKTLSILASGGYRVVAFHRAGDLVGLAENGAYTNTAQAITPVIANRLPVRSLARLLRSDPDLLYHFLCKLCHELRGAQFHTMMLGRHDAIGRIAMFLRERGLNNAAVQPSPSTRVPMTRSDIAAYLGLSLEAASRSFRHLQRLGIIKLRDRHRVDITDHARLEVLASGM